MDFTHKAAATTKSGAAWEIVTLSICNLQLYKQHLLCEQHKQSHQSLSLWGHDVISWRKPSRLVSEEGSSSIPWLGLQGKLRANQHWEHSSPGHFVVIPARWWTRKRREALICRQTSLRRKMHVSAEGGLRGTRLLCFVPHKDTEDDGRGERPTVSLWVQTYWVQSSTVSSIFTDMSSFPLHYIISTQSPNHNLHSKQILKYEWPLYIRIDLSPAAGFLHDNEARLHT